MPFTGFSLEDALNSLAKRLGDPSFVHWTRAELRLAVYEALQFWNTTSLYFRQRGNLTTTSGTAFYDLGTLLTSGTTKLLERTTTDAELVSQIAYHLIEPQNTSNWTEQFDVDACLSAIERRRDQYLFETGLVQTVSEINVPAPNISRIPLDQSIIDVRRVAWEELDENGDVFSRTPLWRVDERTLLANLNNYEDADAPEMYTQVLQPEVSIQLAPAPINKGKLHLVTVNSGGALDGSGVPLNIQNDFTQFIRWGVEADLLGQDGQGRDAGRSQYAEQRFKEGVLLGKIAVSAMNAQINGVPSHLVSFFDLDAGDPTWQDSSGQPEYVGMGGLNLVALSDVPNGVYSITLDTVRNAIIPASDGDPIQIDQSLHSIILDYAFHLAMFKSGGVEFQASLPHFKRIMQVASKFNSKLKAQSRNFESMRKVSKREEEQRPSMEVAA